MAQCGQGPSKKPNCKYTGDFFQNIYFLQYIFSFKQCIKQNDTVFPLEKLKLYEFITEVVVRLMK